MTCMTPTDFEIQGIELYFRKKEGTSSQQINKKWYKS